MNESKINICIAQIEVVPGNPALNTKTMLEAIHKAKRDYADVIVFPEMSIPGYILGDTWERQSFIEECWEFEKDIVGASEGIVIIFGNITHDHSKVNEDGRVRKHNTAIIAANREIASKRIKTLQPNYREFDDNRHFYDNRKVLFDKILERGADGVRSSRDFFEAHYGFSYFLRNGIKIGVMLCEDGWDDDYSMSPADCLYRNCDILVNISCSPFTFGKNDKRNRVFSTKAKKFAKPLVYVNCVGCQNNGKTVYTFDGNSCIYDHNGKMFNPYPTFEPSVETFEIDVSSTFAENTTLKRTKTDWFYDMGVSSNTFEDHKDDIKDIHKSLVYGIGKFINSLGLEKVVIGVSGGIDSAVVATLFCDVVGHENLTLINMPSKFNSDLTKDAAKKLAENLDCRYIVMPIEESVSVTKKQLEEANLECSDFTVENIQARDRSSRILAAVAASVGGVFTCNANKSEMTIGYTTLYGDLGGFMAPISDLWKGQVYELARHINDINGCTVIPQETIDVVPSAELSDKQDVTKGEGDPLVYPYHDKLFASWVERWSRATPEDNLRWYVDGTLAKEIGYDGDINKLFPTAKDFIRDLEKWWKCYGGLGVAKRIQAPPVLAVSRRAFGFDHRETQTPPYYSKRYLALKEQILG